MDEGKLKIKRLLESEPFGLTVDEVKEVGNEQRADLRAFDMRGTQYLIEVKSRDTDREFDSELRTEGKAYHVVPSGYRNTMSAKIRNAASQLSATPTSGVSFRLVAFSSSQVDSHECEIYANQFRMTLYGIVDLLIQRNESGPIETLPCFYFTYSEFMREPSIDGAIIRWGDKTQICANPFGLQMRDFTTSSLFEKYLELGGVLDPAEAECKGIALIADVTGNPPMRQDMIRHIEQKYGLFSAGIIEFKLAQGSITIRAEDLTV